jgi:hypothetical protein
MSEKTNKKKARKQKVPHGNEGLRRLNFGKF